MAGWVGPFPRVEAGPEQVCGPRLLLHNSLKESSPVSEPDSLIHCAQPLLRSDPAELCLCLEQQGLDKKTVPTTMSRRRCQLFKQAENVVKLVVRRRCRQARFPSEQ